MVIYVSIIRKGGKFCLWGDDKHIETYSALFFVGWCVRFFVSTMASVLRQLPAHFTSLCCLKLLYNEPNHWQADMEGGVFERYNHFAYLNAGSAFCFDFA